MRVVYYVVIMNLHMIAIGHAFESTAYPSSLITCSYAFALLASVDLSLLIVGSLSSLHQLLGQLFNFGFLRQQLYNHKDMAYSALFFASLHILLHAIQWIISPNIQFHSRIIYSTRSPSFITGVVTVVGFAGAALSAYKPGVHSLLYLPLASLGLVSFFCHGYQGVIASPLGSILTFSLLLLCACVCILFFLFHPLQLTKVSTSIWERAESEDQFALLDVYYENSNLILPGSYFNIFGPTSPPLSLFGGQPFPVFSSREGKITFFIHCAQSRHHSDLLEYIAAEKYPIRKEQIKSRKEEQIIYIYTYTNNLYIYIFIYSFISFDSRETFVSSSSRALPEPASAVVHQLLGHPRCPL